MAEINSLGSFLPVLNQGISLITKADTLFGSGAPSKTRRESRARAELDLRQLAARQALEGKTAQTKQARDLAILEAQTADDERRRMGALKRAVARQRAVFGGSGVEADSGSGEAVLLGLFSESEQEKTAQDSIHALRRQIVNDNADALLSRNLLELSQAQDRYRILGD